MQSGKNGFLFLFLLVNGLYLSQNTTDEVTNYNLNIGLLIDTYYFFLDMFSFQIGQADYWQKQYCVIVLVE